MAARTWKTEAVVLRSLRYGEADRILHLYTLERGRIGAIAKGVRRTRSKFGGRLEPMSHVELLLHQGRGDLHTVTGADLVRSHDRGRVDPFRMAVGHIGLEAMLKLFVEEEANAAAFHALSRFLDLLEGVPSGTQPALEPLGLSFQLKLLWLAGYLPHLSSCAACGSEEGLVAFSPRAGGAVCAACQEGAHALSPEGFAGILGLLERPLAEARDADLTERGLRETLRVVESSYEEHGGFRMRTLRAAG